jgi:hypothetical protein
MHFDIAGMLRCWQPFEKNTFVHGQVEAILKEAEVDDKGRSTTMWAIDQTQFINSQGVQNSDKMIWYNMT